MRQSSQRLIIYTFQHVVIIAGANSIGPGCYLYRKLQQGVGQDDDTALAAL